MTSLTLAGPDLIARVTGRAPYANGEMNDPQAARLNTAVLEAAGGSLPCYASPGKRVGFRWVSVGSSCVIPRALAARWLARFGVDLDLVEESFRI